MANENKASEIIPYNPSEENVVVYRTEDRTLELDVQLKDETVWLTQQQMASLFNLRYQMSACTSIIYTRKAS